MSIIESKKEDTDLDAILESTLEDFEEDEKQEQQKISSSSIPISQTLKEKEVKKETPTKEKESKDSKLEQNDVMKELLSELSNSLGMEMPDLDNLPDLENEELLKKLVEDMDQNFPGVEQMMEGMMGKLMSKDVLYEPLKEMRDKYPEWLATNKGNISSEDYSKYIKQLEIVKKICLVFETDAENMQKVTELMQALQEIGQPPLELMKGIAPDLELNDEGLPTLPELDGFQNNKDCIVM